MTTTNKDMAARLRAMAAELDGTAVGTVAATLRAEADRLYPPAPTGKTVTWRGHEHWRDATGGIAFGDPTSAPWGTGMACSREYIDAVVLPLLADAPDGPIPDETVDAACEVDVRTRNAGTWEDYAPTPRAQFRHGMRAALMAVRGLPGMAVVRTGAEDTEDARRWRALCKAVRSRPGHAIPWGVFTWHESPPTPDDLARALDDVQAPDVAAEVERLNRARAGKPPEVLEWGYFDNAKLVRGFTETGARKLAPPGCPVVAIIADPGEGTA